MSQSLLMYSAMILKGKLKRALSFLTRKSVRLVDLGTVMTSMHVRNQHYAGLESVKIDSIKGSEGKRSNPASKVKRRFSIMGKRRS